MKLKALAARMARSLFVTILLTAPLSAQQSTRGHELQDPMVVGESFLLPKPDLAVATERLRAHPESRVVFPAFEMDLLEDGRRVFRGVLITQKSEADETIYFTVDPVLGTYQTFRPEDVPELAAADAASGSNFLPQKRPIRCTCPDPCTGEWVASVRTFDPIFEKLTETTSSGDWYTFGPTCKLNVVGDGDC